MLKSAFSAWGLRVIGPLLYWINDTGSPSAAGIYNLPVTPVSGSPNFFPVPGMGAHVTASDGLSLYAASSAGVFRCSLANLANSTLIGPTGGTFEIALDAQNVYWVELFGNSYRIVKAPK